MTVELPRPAPSITPDTAAFWAGTLEGKLLLERCEDCDTVVWYPRGGYCPVCGKFSTKQFEAAGTGSVYTFTVVHRGLGDYAKLPPFVLAYVELDEGPRLMTNVIDCEPDDVHIGMRVRAVFHDTGQGSAIYRFVPESDAERKAASDAV